MSRLEELFYKLKEFNLSKVLTIEEIVLFIPKNYEGTDVGQALSSDDDDVIRSTYDYIFRLELVKFQYKSRYEKDDIFNIFYFVPSPYREIIENAIKIASFNIISEYNDDVSLSIKKCEFYRLEILENVIIQLTRKLRKCEGKQKLSSYEADVTLLNSLSKYCSIEPDFKVPENNYSRDKEDDEEDGFLCMKPINLKELLSQMVSTDIDKEVIKNEIDDFPFEKNNSDSQKRFLLSLQGFFFEDNEYLTYKFRDAILDIKVFLSNEMIEGGNYKINIDTTSFLLDDLFFDIDMKDMENNIPVLISDNVAICIKACADKGISDINEIIDIINEHRFSILTYSMYDFIGRNFSNKKFISPKKLSHSAMFNEAPRMMNVEDVLNKLPHKLAYKIGEIE